MLENTAGNEKDYVMSSIDEYFEILDREAQKRAAEKNNARKPSAILEEIEGMFGAPELTDYTIE